jgi:hypothetical protein
MVIFNSYVKLPEGNYPYKYGNYGPSFTLCAAGLGRRRWVHPGGVGQSEDLGARGGVHGEPETVKKSGEFYLVKTIGSAKKPSEVDEVLW